VPEFRDPGESAELGFHTCGTSAPILCAGRSSFERIVGRVIF